MAGTIDAVLNFTVPALIILIVISFVYSKIFEPLLMPHLRKAWEYMRGENDNSKYKEIIYDGF